MAKIIVTNLEKTYKTNKISYPILKGINFQIDDKEFISICGPSGSGKTTLLYVLSGLEPYQKGSILFNEIELNNMSDHDKSKLRSVEIGFVFQFYNLIPNLTVYENIKLASLFGLNESKENTLKKLDIVGMRDYANYYPNQLSGGQQQRVSIARALINNPKIIFADEPIGSLDYQNGLLILETFKKLNQELGITILMVTHNEDTIKYGTRVLYMLDGKVIKDEKVSK